MNRVDEYLETKVMTASGPQLHLMVIDGAIRFAKQAETGLEAGDIEAAHFALNKSRDFVTELISGLDEKKSPDLIEKLKGLFLFIYSQLVEADSDRDVQKVRDAIKILQMHRETWLELIEKLIEENQIGGLNTAPSPKSPALNSQLAAISTIVPLSVRPAGAGIL